jgi:hypothetical protein
LIIVKQKHFPKSTNFLFVLNNQIINMLQEIFSIPKADLIQMVILRRLFYFLNIPYFSRFISYLRVFLSPFSFYLACKSNSKTNFNFKFQVFKFRRLFRSLTFQADLSFAFNNGFLFVVSSMALIHSKNARVYYFVSSKLCLNLKLAYN